MSTESDSIQSDSNQMFDSRTVHALLFSTVCGAVLTGALSSGLLLRLDVATGWSYGVGFSLLWLLLYPCFRALGEARGKPLPLSFASWAALWLILAGGGFVLLYPLVSEMIGKMF